MITRKITISLKKVKVFAAFTALTAASFLSACGSSSNDQKVASVSYDCSQPKAGPVTKIKVSAFPIVSNGALYAGVEEGFFDKHGLDVTFQTMASPAAGLAAVQGGTTDFAFTPSVSLFQAVGNGVPLKIVAPFAGIAPGYYDKMKAGDPKFQTEITALAVAKDSDIKRPRDLTGKTVSVADVQGQSELTSRYVIDKDGGDSSRVKFTNLGLPDGANALKAGKVDAAFTADPFLTDLEASGAKVISWPGVETYHEGPTSAMVASTSYVNKNRETVARFNCAIRESAKFANAHHDVIRAEVAKLQKVDPSTLSKAVVAAFFEFADVDGLNRFKKIMLDYKYLNKDFAVDDILVPEAVAPDDAKAVK